jgi:hypothetical protein
MRVYEPGNPFGVKPSPDNNIPNSPCPSLFNHLKTNQINFQETWRNKNATILTVALARKHIHFHEGDRSMSSSTLEVGKKLVDLCRQGKAKQAIETLYDPKIVSVEAQGGPNFSQRMEGIAAVKGKAEWWEANHEVHKAEANGPWPHGDRFIVHFKYEVTAKSGPMAGKRFTMEEGALYTVKNDKVVQEEFFYSM